MPHPTKSYCQQAPVTQMWIVDTSTFVDVDKLEVASDKCSRSLPPLIIISLALISQLSFPFL